MFNQASHVKWAKISAVTLLVSCLGFGYSFWQARTPPKEATNRALQIEPKQTATTMKPLLVERKGIRYEIEPLYDYEINGLIVSDHDSASPLDLAHALWQDYLNTKDICVIWGRNVVNGYLDLLNFSSQDWTCWVQTSSSEAWQQFNPKQLANNHVLPANDDVERALRLATVGDEVRIKGHLVNYNREGAPPRKTSTIRDDTGNGACEIIYVTEVETYFRHNQKWIRLKSLFQLTATASGAGLLFSIFVLPFLISQRGGRLD